MSKTINKIVRIKNMWTERREQNPQYSYNEFNTLDGLNKLTLDELLHIIYDSEDEWKHIILNYYGKKMNGFYLEVVRGEDTGLSVIKKLKRLNV